MELACCVVVGDRESDVEAARNAGQSRCASRAPRALAEAVETILYWVGGPSAQ